MKSLIMVPKEEDQGYLLVDGLTWRIQMCPFKSIAGSQCGSWCPHHEITLVFRSIHIDLNCTHPHTSMRVEPWV